jgi:hypothetical protein
LDNEYTYSVLSFLDKILILLLLSLVMGPEEGDEHFHHHPVCEVCHKEFDDVHELSKHVNQEHRNLDRAA